MGRIVGFKLSYCMGVSKYELRKNYDVESRILELYPFDDVVVRFRSLSGIYFEVIKHYQSLTLSDDVENIQAWLDDFKERIGDSSYVPLKEKGNHSFLDYLAIIVREHTRLIDKVYNALEPGISLRFFREMVKLVDLSNTQAMQLSFVLREVRNTMGIYFVGRDIFNVSMITMLKNDANLRSRLSLYSGTNLLPVEDTSSWADKVTAYVDDVFIDISSLSYADNLFYYNISNAVKARLLKDAVIASPLDDSAELKGCSVITMDNDWVKSRCEQGVKAKFYIPLPVPSSFYGLWRSRHYQNVYLIRKDN